MSFTLAPADRRNGACPFWPRCVAEVRLIIAHSLCVVMKNISRASEKDPRKVSLGLFLCPTFHAFWVGFFLEMPFHRVLLPTRLLPSIDNAHSASACSPAAPRLRQSAANFNVSACFPSPSWRCCSASPMVPYATTALTVWSVNLQQNQGGMGISLGFR